MRSQESAVILARVSSKAQEDEGYSLDAQLKLLQDYTARKQLNVKKVFRIAETASKEQSRRIFNEMLLYVKKAKVQHLIVEKTDRLTRNLQDAVVIDDWLHADAERRLHMVKESLVVHKEAKSDVKFMWNIYVAVAKKFTDNLREEAMKGWAEKLAQGWLPAPPPVGYKTVTENGKKIHIVDQKTARIVKEMFRRYLQSGESIESIRAEMERRGLRSRRGRPFAKSQVQNILKNPFYMGVISFNGSTYPGAHKPLITKELHAKVMEKMTGKSPTRIRKHYPLLKGMMFCADCGKMVSWQYQKKRYYGACQRNSEVCKKRKMIRQEDIEVCILERLRYLLSPTPAILDWVVDSVNSDTEATQLAAEKQRTDYEAQIRRYETMMETLYDDKLAGDISPDKYQEKRQKFTAQITSLKLQADKLSTDNTQSAIEEAIGIVKLTQEAAHRYTKVNDEEKREIITKLFNNLTASEETTSVTYTKLVGFVAEKSEKTRQLLMHSRTRHQTQKNDPINWGHPADDPTLRSVWQGWRDSNPRPSVLETDALAS